MGKHREREGKSELNGVIIVKRISGNARRKVDVDVDLSRGRDDSSPPIEDHIQALVEEVRRPGKKTKLIYLSKPTRR